MKVTSGYKPYSYRQQNAQGKGTGFADMYSDMRARRGNGASTELAEGTGSEAQKDEKEIRAWHDVTFHSGIGHLFQQFHPSKEWLISTVGQPNAESKGDKELTGSQLHFLQSRYDIENLTSQERNNLLCDLTDMGVLSAADLSSEDQSKVEDVFEQIKSFKIGVGTYVEFPNELEAIISDYSDPEFRGMSDDEKFAAIMKKYDYGTTIGSFKQVTSALFRNKLLTLEQSEALFNLAMDDYVEKRGPSEIPGRLTMEQVMFDYRVNVGDFIKEAHSLNPTWVQMKKLSQLFEASSKN